MLMLAIDSTSTLRYFNPKTDKADQFGNSARFQDCVSTFFPWQSVRAVDLDAEAVGDRISPADLQKRAAKALYERLRCPLVHAGGVVGRGTAAKTFPRISIVDKYPGLGSFEANNRDLCSYCLRPDLRGEIFLKFGQFQIQVFTRPLYWAVRRMIENFAANPQVQADISAKVL